MDGRETGRGEDRGYVRGLGFPLFLVVDAGLAVKAKVY